MKKKFLSGVCLITILLAALVDPAAAAEPTPQDDPILLISAEQAGIKAVALSGDESTVFPNQPHRLEEVETQNNSQLAAVSSASFIIDYVPSDQYGNISNRYPCSNFPGSTSANARAALTEATNRWAGILNPRYKVPIHVQACWSYLDSADVLALVKVPNYAYRFPNAPQDGTLYPISLANALSGSDLDGTTPEIAILINSRQVKNFYYGTDSTPSDRYNLVSILMHLIAHGLGFNASLTVYKNNNVDYGRWGIEVPGMGALPLAYDTYVVNQQGDLLSDTEVYPQNSKQLAEAIKKGAVFFNGENARSANNDQAVPLHAPAAYQKDENISHLADSFKNTPHALMTSGIAKGDTIYLPGEITRSILHDIGWDIFLATPRPPTQLSLSKTELTENAPLNSEVAVLSTIDPNSNSGFTYELVPGEGSEDNGAFVISGDRLRTQTAMDYETKSTFAIRLRTTDADGLYLEEAFTILVRNSNDAPADVLLSSATVIENQPAGTVIGQLSTIDQDEGSRHTYSLGCAGRDNTLVKLEGNVLKTADEIDREARQRLEICIRSTDTGKLVKDKPFSITVENVNETATWIGIQPAWVLKDTQAGERIGRLVCDDPDIGDALTYTFVPGVPGDNDLFVIEQDVLLAKAPLTRGSDEVYTLQVQVRDAANTGPDAQTVTIPVVVTLTSYLPSIRR